MFTVPSDPRDYDEAVLASLNDGFDPQFSGLRYLYKLLYRGPSHDSIIDIGGKTCLFDLCPSIIDLPLPADHDVEMARRTYNLFTISGIGTFLMLGSLHYQHGGDNYSMIDLDEDEEDDLFKESMESPFSVVVRVISDPPAHSKSGAVYLVRRPNCEDRSEAFGKKPFNIAKVADNFRQFLSPDAGPLTIIWEKDVELSYAHPVLPLESDDVADDPTTSSRLKDSASPQKRPSLDSEDYTSKRRRFNTNLPSCSPAHEFG